VQDAVCSEPVDTSEIRGFHGSVYDVQPCGLCIGLPTFRRNVSSLNIFV
jgi:hypothetical protein